MSVVLNHEGACNIYHINNVIELQHSAKLVEHFITNEWQKTVVYKLKSHASGIHIDGDI